MIVAQFQYEMPWAVAPDTRIEDARKLMTTNRLRHLPVVDGDRVVGMLSDHDVLAELARARAWMRDPPASGAAPPPVRETVGEIMATPAHTTRRETPISDAISTMIEQRISALPVVDLEGLSGIVTTTNFLWWYRDYAIQNPAHAAATLVSDHMAGDPATAERSADVGAIALIMSDRRVSHVPIVDGRRLVGIVSERDIVRETGRMPSEWRGVHAADDPAGSGATAADIMTARPHTTTPGETVGVAAGAMAEHKVGALPVVEGDTLVGVISVTDVIKLVRELAGGD
jgi:acetoin utilization protein AcuB